MFGWSLRTVIANLKSPHPVSFEIIAEFPLILSEGGWGQKVLLWEIILDNQVEISVKPENLTFALHVIW